MGKKRDKIVVYDKEGNQFFHDYPVDAKEAIATGRFFAVNPNKPLPVPEPPAPEVPGADITLIKPEGDGAGTGEPSITGQANEIIANSNVENVTANVTPTNDSKPPANENGNDKPEGPNDSKPRKKRTTGEE